MTKTIKTLKFKLFVLALAGLLLIPCTTASAARKLPVEKIKVAVTTSHLANLVNEICKEKVEITTILQPTTCPSNYDIDAVMMKKISRSNIILYHSWQPWVKKLKFEISNLGIVYRDLKTDGNLMIPYINIRGAQEIKDLFVIWDSDNKDYYEKNFLEYVFKVSQLADEISRGNVYRRSKKAVCQDKIADFMQWLGFDVVAEYGKTEDIPPSEMMRLSKIIRKNKVAIVVDNLQTGTDIGRTLSGDLKIKYAVISNFPLGGSYVLTLKDNISKIDKALK